MLVYLFLKLSEVHKVHGHENVKYNFPTKTLIWQTAFFAADLVNYNIVGRE